ncbi:hypothetical protein LTR66_014920 [Elasticomyces elasticus]|nr:hypothetical protein LTR66_014920 [Elasticomyces elasticus]
MASGQAPKRGTSINTEPPTPRYAPSLTTSSLAEDPNEDATVEDSTQPSAASRHSSTTEARREYGTIDSSEVGTVRKRAPPKRQPSHLTRSRPMSPTGFAPLSPQTTHARPRPANPRRASTNKKPLPYRGEFFSVDDDVSEVEEDREQHRKDRDEDDDDFPRLSRPNTLRRKTVHNTPLPRIDSAEEILDDALLERRNTLDRDEEVDLEDEGEDTEVEANADDPAEEEGELSDTESFTLRDRQLAINETHPFGIRIWKPALYKKNRSVEKNAEDDIHSSPSQIVSKWLWIFNCLWTILFGWWLAGAAALSSLVCKVFFFDASAAAYAETFWGLATYLFWPFGRFVKLEADENYADEDEGEGRSVSEYERWQSGDLEYGRLMFGPGVTHMGGSIVGRHRNSVESASERDSLLARKRRLFGRGSWNLGRVIFFGLFYFFVAPLILLVSGLCWFMVFWIPMGRVLTILFYHLRKRPLALTFHPDVSYARNSTKPSSIILCTYRAAGLKYWKFTLDGTNIFLINFLSVVAFVIIDYFFIGEILGVESWITSPALLFPLGLLSIIPLAYFIGQAVASISAQSSMGLGAVIHAFFSTIVEVFLYYVALRQGKGRLVEGSIVGSIFAGILLMPGLSMCFGAIKRKTQRYNVKSASATSTMLLFAMIAAFGPTLFYKIYGSHELICKSCSDGYSGEPRDCRQCYFRQMPAPEDPFFVDAVRPYCWIAATLLFLSYAVGLLFTLRTHAATIWQTDLDEKKSLAMGTSIVPIQDISPSDTRTQSVQNSMILSQPPNTPKPAIRETQMYKRILDKSLKAAGVGDQDQPNGSIARTTSDSDGVARKDYVQTDNLPHIPPPKQHDTAAAKRQPLLAGLSGEDNANLIRQVAELASTAAAVAARDAVTNPRQASYMVSHTKTIDPHRPSTARFDTMFDARNISERGPHSHTAGAEAAAGGGHDAPNWSRTKSAVILCTATLAYAAVAEVLVDTVDVILSSVEIDEKFLGITLFALVPNTTEFLNAISFAMNGNIALSMEIGSAYVLQVALLQIPALVLFSAFYQGHVKSTADLADYTFNLIFPQWDMVTVILCVFLLSYVNSEGKSNYFKGSILVMTYLVILMGFYYSGSTGIDMLGVDPGNLLAMNVHKWDSLMSTKAGRSLAREL